MKLIISGSRGFSNYELLCLECNKLLAQHDITEIFSGGAKGADQLGEKYAIANNIPIRQFIPDWERVGKSAGYIRNEEMASYADILIAFWDGESKGTEHMINIATRKKLTAYIVNTKIKIEQNKLF